jgi:hypothetical protein
MKLLITEQQFRLINENGINSIIVYHGTNSDFKTFTTDFVGGKKAIDQEGPGVYFTTSKEDAEHYGKYIYKVELTPRKLLFSDKKGNINRNTIIKLIKMRDKWELNAQDWDENITRGLNYSVDSILDNDNDKDIITQVFIEYYRYRALEYVKNCTKLGIDGIVINKNENSQHIVVYNPNIIKIIQQQINNISEDVGEKYAEKVFGIKPEFSEFEEKFKKLSLKKEKEDIIFQFDDVIIIKNPKTLNNIGPSVRGIIDKHGNLYTEMNSKIIHKTLISIIGNVLNYRLKPITNWHITLPIDFITVQRDKNTNTFQLGESNFTMRTENEREESKRMGYNWSNVPNREEAEPIFNDFLNKAKIKNPKINFSNKLISSWDQY